MSLSERWLHWLRCSGTSTHHGALTLGYVKSVVRSGLEKEGFEVPRLCEFKEGLEDGLQPIVRQATPGVHGLGMHCVSFVHFVNLLWRPMVQYLESFVAGRPAPWTSKLAKHAGVLVLEMRGLVPEPDTSLIMDDWLLYVQGTIKRLVDVTVPQDVLLNVLGAIVPCTLAPTRANGLSCLRAPSVASKLVGSTLATQVSRRILSEVSELPVDLLTEHQVLAGVKEDIVGQLALVHRPRPAAPEPQDLETPQKKARRSKVCLREMLEAKTRQCRWILENRLACRRAGATLLSASDLIQRLVGTAEPLVVQADLQAVLVSRQALAQHFLLLDGALDRRTSDLIFKSREDGTFAGVAFATDESPPKQPRFRGWRFQISIMYLGFFPSVSTWDSSPTPPIQCLSMLADIMHCPGKKGTDVSRVLERQLSRVGVSIFDVVSGTGDGGGENEGSSGIHAYFEHLSPGYVRRRCLPHIAWRTGDMAIRASNLDYRSLCSYLTDGVTWSRLRALAVQPEDEGGLGLFQDGSRQCQAIFMTAPSGIVTTRPETDLKFLKFLSGKEHVLHRLAVKDLEQRQLGPETISAVQKLGDIKARIRRAILGELLERCFFLYYWNSKHNLVVLETTWQELLAKATEILWNLDVSNEFLERIGSSREDFDALVPEPKTWVEMVVLQVVGDRDLVDVHLAEAVEFHRSVTDSSASHLALVGENTFRTPWLAATILSSDRVRAQGAAKDLAMHLATTRPSNRTAFEKHLFETQELWKDLEAFSTAAPPVLLWHDHGKYECLFRFLAPRFLLAPDHVLDCERVHARWQWACLQKRSLKVHSLNALLRLTHYDEHNVFPQHTELQEHLEAEAAEHKRSLDAIGSEGVVASGWKTEFLYRARLGLSPDDVHLVGGPPGPPPAPQATAGTAFSTAWRNYAKSLFRKGCMYQLSLHPQSLLYVCENKTLSGREEKEHFGEATGRKLVVAWFEVLADGRAHRVDQETSGMRPHLLTLAEIMQILGVDLARVPDRAAAETERLLEQHMVHLQVRKRTCLEDIEADEVHVYLLGEEEDAEEAMILETPPDGRTKMMYARHLQRSEHLNDGESLEDAWKKPLEELRRRSAATLPEEPPEPPAARGGGARGRGARGRGRGGRGRRGRGRAHAAVAGA